MRRVSAFFFVQLLYNFYIRPNFNCLLSIVSSLYTIQVTLCITPLTEGCLVVTGFLYNLCVDSTQGEGTESPIVGSTHSRSNLPSMAVSSLDVLYQRRHSSGISRQSPAFCLTHIIHVRICSGSVFSPITCVLLVWLQ